MIQVVPTQPLSSQTLRVTLGNQACRINIYTKEIWVPSSGPDLTPPQPASGFFGSISGHDLTVYFETIGSLTVGQVLVGQGVADNNYVTGGGEGLWSVSVGQNLGPRPMFGYGGRGRTIPTSNVVLVPIPGQQGFFDVDVVSLPNFGKADPVFTDLYVNDALIIGGVLSLDQVLIVRDVYLGFVGDLYWVDTTGQGADPLPAGLGSRWQLVYDTDAP